mmetsp:Transcript_14104/g.29178  ORF Transcript_14104/g.29178 Transcript_14104/m.29178 type:complete len:259 (-) Transcript_14104:3-779(-)
MKGDPTATPHPRANSVAFPLTFWWTAKEALIPAPLTSLPCSYRRRTEGPIPLGQTAMTSMSSGNFSPMESRYPKRNPWESPRVAPGFMAAKISLYNLAWAASEINNMTKSEFLITSYISPRVPSSSLKPTALACSKEEDPSRSPMVTLMSVPASFKESAMFWAWAGAWDPHPITPTFLMPSKALGRRGKRSRPPFTMVSFVSAKSTSVISKISEEKAFIAVGEALLTTALRGANAEADEAKKRAVAAAVNFILTRYFY